MQSFCASRALVEPRVRDRLTAVLEAGQREILAPGAGTAQARADFSLKDEEVEGSDCLHLLVAVGWGHRIGTFLRHDEARGGEPTTSCSAGIALVPKAVSRRS